MADASWQVVDDLESFEHVDRRVLLCVDSSAQSERAFAFYLEKLFIAGDVLILVSVLQYGYFVGLVNGPVTRPIGDLSHYGDMKNAERALTVRLETFSRRLRERSIKHRTLWRRSVLSAGPCVCAAASEERADLIVMGTRHPTAWQRLLGGDVNNFVLRNANVPVCTVP